MRSQPPSEFIVLGLLHSGPMHGYEVQRALRRELGDVWRVGTSQLYSVLKRLEREDLVKRTTLQQRTRPPRKVYQITQEGIDKFSRWAVAPQRSIRELRVEFLGKVALLSKLNRREDLSRLLESQRAVCRARLNRLLAQMDGASGRMQRHVLLFRILQAQAAIQWLDAIANEPLNGDEK